MSEQQALLTEKCVAGHYEKLSALNNAVLMDFVAEFVEHCNPDSVYVCDDSAEDRQYIRARAVELGEEKALATEGHTIHFDGPQDQARDKAQTKYLLNENEALGPMMAHVAKEEGLAEVKGFLKDSMVGKQMYVLFFCLGPTNSDFSLSCVQLTDSCYVAHSEYILYRTGYEQFKKIPSEKAFFRFVHTAGELENGVSKNTDKRRVYIHLEENIVYSTNTQYAGNTVGLKKLALRLAINKASKEDWLAEHMFLLGVTGPEGRKTYFSGAFPSACGKTSTAMLPDAAIVGDDIAYLRKRQGKVYGANVETGIFGIIQDVNPQADPIIWNTLNTPGEVIFSNVLLGEDSMPYWRGDGREIPEKGVNFSGAWQKGNVDSKGNEIPHAHKNARYTVNLATLKNVDPLFDSPEGVPLAAVVYGGRDSSVFPPVLQSFDWAHGVVTMGASLESETTAATLGKEGVRQLNPMSNIDFLALSLGDYVKKHLDFIKDVEKQPIIFGVNYFQKDENGTYRTGIQDKICWIHWMERRFYNEMAALRSPIGYIPCYEDVAALFRSLLQKDYSREDYDKQFTLNIPANIAKAERILDFYAAQKDMPAELSAIINEQKTRLIDAQKQYGDMLSPAMLT